MKLSVIVPVYNEEKTILSVLERVRETVIEGVEFEVIVVDDGSKDKSRELLTAHPELYTKLFLHAQNGGKGAAVKTALQIATGDFVIFQDADLEYDPKEYSTMIEPVRDRDADVVIGSRFLAPKHTRVHYFWHKFGNRLLTLFFNILYNTTFTDIYSCYLLFRRDLIDPNELRTFGWEQHAEILCKCVRKGKIYYEVTVSYYGRTYEEGKKIKAYHALGVFWTIFRNCFSTSQLPASKKDTHPAGLADRNLS